MFFSVLKDMLNPSENMLYKVKQTKPISNSFWTFAFNLRIFLVFKGVFENRLLFYTLNFPVLCLCKERARVRAKMKKDKIENCWGRLILQRKKMCYSEIYLSIFTCLCVYYYKNHTVIINIHSGKCLAGSLQQCIFPSSTCICLCIKRP